jgi:fructose-1,6-bisphosphatase I
MYEANPIAMVIEQAGGAAFAGPDVPILSIVPKDIHQRTPVILGSAAEVEHVLRHLRRG